MNYREEACVTEDVWQRLRSVIPENERMQTARELIDLIPYIDDELVRNMKTLCRDARLNRIAGGQAIYTETR